MLRRYRACRDLQQLRFDYTDNAGNEELRREPYRLVDAGHRWLDVLDPRVSFATCCALAERYPAADRSPDEGLGLPATVADQPELVGVQSVQRAAVPDAHDGAARE